LKIALALGGNAMTESLDRITVTEARRLLAAGESPLSSMGPKVLACIMFVEQGGKMGIVASLEKAIEALNGTAGTRVVPDRAPEA
jgi:carbamate kinase